MKALSAGVGVLLTIGLVAATALAQAPQKPDPGMRGPQRLAERRGMGMDGFGMGDMFLKRLVTDTNVTEKLGLSADQVNSLKKLESDSEGQVTALTTELQQAAVKQAQLIAASATDEAAIMKAVEETGALRTKIAKLRVQQLLGVKRILTPEQQKAARELFRERMRDTREQMKDRRQGMPPPAPQTAPPAPQVAPPSAPPAPAPSGT